MQSDFLTRSYFIRIGITLIVTILKFDSALAHVRTQTELERIMTDSVHCLYCNPAWYPHGLVWYAIMIPIAYFGNPTSDLVTLAAIDMVFLVLSASRGWLFYPYLACSFYDYFVIPQNQPVLWLTFVGLYSPYLMFLPVIAKLPVGSEFFEGFKGWNFILHSSLSITTNYQADYGVLVAFWLYIMAYYHRHYITIGFFRVIEKWTKMRHKKS